MVTFIKKKAPMKIVLIAFLFILSIGAHAQMVPEKYVSFMDEVDMMSYSDKLKKLDKTIKKNPKDPWYYWMRASTYQQMDDLEAAEKDYRTTFEIDPNFAAGYGSLARMIQYSDETRLKEALDLINKAIELDGQEFYYHIDKGRILLDLQQYDSAMDEAMRVLSNETADIMPAVQLVVKVLIAKEDTEGLNSLLLQNDLTKLGGFMETDFDLLIGDLYLGLGEKEKACTSYRFAVEPYEMFGEEVPENISEKLKGCE
jgi:tetratricopeptide (TPR) repeat protein